MPVEATHVAAEHLWSGHQCVCLLSLHSVSFVNLALWTTSQGHTLELLFVFFDKYF